MARKTNKAQALELAATLGVEVEYGYMGDEGFEVALYGYNSHMTFGGAGHTAITNQTGSGIRTEAGVWGAALRDLREFEPCADDCHCRPAPAYVIHGDYYAPGADVDGADPEVLTHYAVEFADSELEARALVADLTMTRPDVDWYYVCQDDTDPDVIVADEDDTPHRDTDPAPGHVHPIVTDDDGYPVVISMPYIITDADSGAKYFGIALSAASPFETMRTMIALALGVSRETVRLWETDNVREYGFDCHGDYRGTVRFTEPARNPYRPAPVTLTHSHHS